MWNHIEHIDSLMFDWPYRRLHFAREYFLREKMMNSDYKWVGDHSMRTLTHVWLHNRKHISIVNARMARYVLLRIKINEWAEINCMFHSDNVVHRFANSPVLISTSTSNRLQECALHQGHPSCTLESVNANCQNRLRDTGSKKCNRRCLVRYKKSFDLSFIHCIRDLRWVQSSIGDDDELEINPALKKFEFMDFACRANTRNENERRWDDGMQQHLHSFMI